MVVGGPQLGCIAEIVELRLPGGKQNFITLLRCNTAHLS
jgi:hypothetical protein